MQQLKKIVVIGPESTGKSTLCENLAKHYQSKWIKEYAREYLLKHGTDYTFDDLLTIAKGQLENEQSAISHQLSAISTPLSTLNSKSSTIFIDTDMYVMKVWCEFVFNDCHRWILDRVAERKYDLYLLCNVDLPWVKDELREYPDLPSRQKLYYIYKDIMVNQNTPWINISGNYEERLQKAIAGIDNIL